jgi:hypothetical protein
VSESPIRLRVSVDNAVVRIILSTVVVGELQDTIAVSPVTVTLEGGRTVIGKEVQGEFVLREVQLRIWLRPRYL